MVKSVLPAPSPPVLVLLVTACSLRFPPSLVWSRPSPVPHTPHPLPPPRTSRHLTSTAKCCGYSQSNRAQYVRRLLVAIAMPRRSRNSPMMVPCMCDGTGVQISTQECLQSGCEKWADGQLELELVKGRT